MHYMIHACPQRMWYVNGYLIPSIKAQGISEEEITIWNDTEGKGNLFTCLESFEACGEKEGGTWHLQDDVIISRDFAEKTREYDDGVVCGFGCSNFGPSIQEVGLQPAIFMWYSFPCIRIPNKVAKEFAEWFWEAAVKRTQYSSQITERKHDDWFFREFIKERKRDLQIRNLTPNLVDHIDYLIGGTLINKQRHLQINRAAFFPDQDLVEELENKIQRTKHG